MGEVVGFEVDRARFAKGLDDRHGEGKRKKPVSQQDPRGKPEDRGETPVRDSGGPFAIDSGLESQGFRSSPSHQVYVGSWHVSSLIVDTGEMAVNKTYFSVPLRSSQPSKGVRCYIKMAAVLVTNRCVQMFTAALFVLVKKRNDPDVH